MDNGLIDQQQYSVLVTVVIASAVIPTLIAQAFFRPHAEIDSAKMRAEQRTAEEEEVR